MAGQFSWPDIGDLDLLIEVITHRLVMARRLFQSPCRILCMLICQKENKRKYPHDTTSANSVLLLLLLLHLILF